MNQCQLKFAATFITQQFSNKKENGKKFNKNVISVFFPPTKTLPEMLIFPNTLILAFGGQKNLVYVVKILSNSLLYELHKK